MNGVMIDGKIYTRDDFDSMSHRGQIDIVLMWFSHTYEHVIPSDSIWYNFVKDHAVDPRDELFSMFGEYICSDIIDSVMADIAKFQNDCIWVPAFDDSVYWIDEQPEDAYMIFQTSIERINEMKSNAHFLGGMDFQQHLFQILYANIFTSFEAYMVRAFINKLFESDETLHQYLSCQKEFKIEQPKITDLLKGDEHIKQVIKIRTDKLKGELISASWHDLGKVATRFNNIRINLRLSASGFKSIKDIRNDIVHRNGRTTSDEAIFITDTDLNHAISVVDSIAHTIRVHELGFEDISEKGDE